VFKIERNKNPWIRSVEMKTIKTSEAQAVSFEMDKQDEGFKAFILRKSSNKIDALTLSLNFLQNRVNSYHPEQDDKGEKAIRKAIRQEIADTKKRVRSMVGINLITDVDGYMEFGLRGKPVEQTVNA
jgi:hypothetical protein